MSPCRKIQLTWRVHARGSAWRTFLHRAPHSPQLNWDIDGSKHSYLHSILAIPLQSTDSTHGIVLMGCQAKNEPKPIKEALACASSKMAMKAAMQAHAPSPSRLELAGMSQKDFFHQIESMLQKALKATSEQITECLTCEIQELGQCNAHLETHVDDMELTINEHTQELGALCD